MVENVTVNELIPAMNPLIYEMLGAGYETAKKLEQAKQKVALVLEFFEKILGDRLYFGSDEITLAEIVACPLTFLPTLLDMPLTQYPKLNAWAERLMQRPSWQTTQPSPEVLEAYKPRAKARMQALLASR
jgi:glutathione S-transferase